ncbi:MAG TPA: hypothetical protein PLO86_01550 [Syntrophales bacterium]|nr:hypothetical protein [Syntrophales bacterium]
MKRSVLPMYGILVLVILLAIPFRVDFFPNKGLLSWSCAGAETYDYYLPYTLSNKDYWTGVALKNGSTTNSASVTVAGVRQNGSSFDTQGKMIPPLGQTAFMMATGEGWVKVTSDQPLTGLAFVAESTGNALMFDITFIPDLAETLYIPHVAQDATWDTVVYVCNPNGSATTVSLAFVGSDGEAVTSTDYTLGVNASGKYPLSGVVGAGLHSSGSLHITASQGVAAFALYNNLKSGGQSYAGISAVEPENPPETSSPSVEEAILGNFQFVYTIISTWTDRITINKKRDSTTSEGTSFYEGYESFYPTTTLALGAWYPSLSKYLILSGSTSASSLYRSLYTFSINADDSLTGNCKISSDGGSTWSTGYSFIEAQSHKTPLASWPTSRDPKQVASDGEEALARKLSEDRETRAQRSESSSSTDNPMASIIAELKVMFENRK